MSASSQPSTRPEPNMESSDGRADAQGPPRGGGWRGPHTGSGQRNRRARTLCGACRKSGRVEPLPPTPSRAPADTGDGLQKAGNSRRANHTASQPRQGVRLPQQVERLQLHSKIDSPALRRVVWDVGSDWPASGTICVTNNDVGSDGTLPPALRACTARRKSLVCVPSTEPIHVKC